MQCKKTWFYHFTISFSIVGLIYIFVCGITSLGEGQEYPYLPKGMLIIGLFSGWILITLLAKIAARVNLYQYFTREKKISILIEVVIVGLILMGALVIRIIVIDKFPMEPASDYKTYYEIAELLWKGTIQKEGKGYCDYIAMFPHVIGYCYILKNAFSLFGNSVLTGQYLNVAFSIGTCFVMYRIGRKLGGRISGAAVLILCAFWPSQVLYITLLSAEYSFTFLFFICVWLFLSLVMDYDKDKGKASWCFILHIVLGVLIALTAAIRPMAQIMLIAVFLCFIPQKMEMPNKPDNEIPVMLHIIKNGWVRCIIIFIPYIIISGIINTNIELTVDRTLPSGSTSFGYNLLVGLNTESVGGWNEEDKDLLYDTMYETGSAAQAHIACRDLAIVRLTSDPAGILNLFIHKYELLWGNDDYGSTWNITLLDEQGNLTKERSDFLYSIRDTNNIIYIITIFFGLMSLVYIYKGKGTYVYVLVLVYLGTVAMHLLVESQNRYHFFVLEVFMVLAGTGIQFIFDDARNNQMKITQTEAVQAENEQAGQIMEIYEQAEIEITKMREEAMENVFDMQYALEHGHIDITVSQAYLLQDEIKEETTKEETTKEETTKEETTKEEKEETIKEETTKEETLPETEIVVEAKNAAPLDTGKMVGEEILSLSNEIAIKEEEATPQENAVFSFSKEELQYLNQLNKDSKERIKVSMKKNTWKQRISKMQIPKPKKPVFPKKVKPKKAGTKNKMKKEKKV